MIIDIHSHLGDVFNLGGGTLIDKKNVVLKKVWDPVRLNERLLNRPMRLGVLAYKPTEFWNIKAQHANIATASLENIQKSMTEAGVDYSVCLPVAPYVTFQDIVQANIKDPRILPFTSVDFTREHDIGRQLEEDVNMGALGLKIHPPIQNIRLDDSRAIEALKAADRLGLPVLLHSGELRNFIGAEKARNAPSNARIYYIARAVRDFPNIRFVVGHAGLYQVNEVFRRLAGLPNVWVDTSFQSPEVIRRLIKVFGQDRVMYGTDWPFGSRLPHIKTIKVACRGNVELENLLFYKNAQHLLGLA